MNRYPLPLVGIIILALALAACGAPAAAPAASAPAAAESSDTVAAAPEAPATEDTTSAPAADSADAITETANLTETEAVSESATTTETVTSDASTSEASPTEMRGVRTFVIVPSESTASYIADEEFFADALVKYGINAGKQDTIGSTQQISGRLTLDLDNLDNALGENSFTVMLNTLESDQGLRDGYIRNNGPRFNAFPEATFIATSIEGAPAAYNDGDEVNFRLIGDITIRDITAPVTFDVAARLTGDILTGVAETNLKMSDFGIEPLSFLGTLTVADDIGVKVEFTAQAE